MLNSFETTANNFLSVIKHVRKELVTGASIVCRSSLVLWEGEGEDEGEDEDDRTLLELMVRSLGGNPAITGAAR